MTQEVKQLPSKIKALSSNPSPAKKTTKQTKKAYVLV
jgi:hypothetical protein